MRIVADPSVLAPVSDHPDIRADGDRRADITRVARTAVDSAGGKRLEGFGRPAPTGRRRRRPSNAARIVAPDERCGRETLSRACPGAYARALAHARERALSTYTFAARNQNPSAPGHSDDVSQTTRRIRSIVGRLNAVRRIRIALSSPGGEKRRAASSTQTPPWTSETPLARAAPSAAFRLPADGITMPSRMRGARRTRPRSRAAVEAMRSPTSLETRAHRSSTRETFPCLADEPFEEVRRSRTSSFHRCREPDPRSLVARRRDCGPFLGVSTA